MTKLEEDEIIRDVEQEHNIKMTSEERNHYLKKYKKFDFWAILVLNVLIVAIVICGMVGMAYSTKKQTRNDLCDEICTKQGFISGRYEDHERNCVCAKETKISFENINYE